MNLFAVSLHIDRPDAALSRQSSALVRVAPQQDWSAALKEITARTAGPFGSAILGLHDKAHGSEYFHYTAIAHRRQPDGSLIQPANAADALYKPGGFEALNDILSRRVAAEVVIHLPGALRADDHLYLPVSAAAHARMRAAVALTAINPPPYHLVQQNCATFGRDIMRNGGVSLPALPQSVAAGPRRLQTPAHWSVAIQAVARTGDSPNHIALSGKPLLLGNYTP